MSRLLALADDEFMIGHRHSEWLGLSPFLEEDLTTASIAQDELGHARALYACIWPTEVNREAELVRRSAGEWRSCALAERAGFPWEFALVRHWLYDLIEPFRWEAVRAQLNELGVEGLVDQVLQEEHFHLMHAVSLVSRLAENDSARRRLQKSLNDLASDALSLAMETGEEAVSALRSGVNEFGLSLHDVVGTLPDRAVRHADAAEVLQQLVAVVSYDPLATW